MSEYTYTQRCLCMQHVLFDIIQLPHQSGIVGRNETATLCMHGHQLSRQLDIASTASVTHASTWDSSLHFSVPSVLHSSEHSGGTWRFLRACCWFG